MFVALNKTQNNMKTKLLFATLLLASITMYAQQSIPNGNFESWDATTKTFPKNYSNNSNVETRRGEFPVNCERSTDAFHGNYAVKLTTVGDTSEGMFGYFINADTKDDPADWHGGLPYNEKPTGIRGHYKYDIKPGDTAHIIIAFSKNGSSIGFYNFPITGQSSSYTSFNFTLSPALTQTPDSVIFGAVSSNAFNESYELGSMLLLDSISLTGVTTQPSWFNGDFEVWDSIIFESPKFWYNNNSSRREIQTIKTTDAHKGSYAVKLTTRLDEKNNGRLEADPEGLNTAYYQENCFSCNAIGGYPFNKTNDTIVIWYKYTSNGNAQAEFRYTLMKMGNIIGGNQMLLGAAATYQKIEVPINSMQAPDTLQLFFQSSQWQDSLVSQVGSTLIIDEVQLKSEQLNTALNKDLNNDLFRVFPNPASDKLYIKQNHQIQSGTFQLYDIYGKLTLQTSINYQFESMNISQLPEGIYFYMIESNANESTTGKIIIKH